MTAYEMDEEALLFFNGRFDPTITIQPEGLEELSKELGVTDPVDKELLGCLFANIRERILAGIETVLPNPSFFPAGRVKKVLEVMQANGYFHPYTGRATSES